jgi:hypothetical protein
MYREVGWAKDLSAPLYCKVVYDSVLNKIHWFNNETTMNYLKILNSVKETTISGLCYTV